MERLVDISSFESLGMSHSNDHVFNAIPSRINVSAGQLPSPPKMIMTDKRGYKQFVQMLLSAARQLRAAGFDDNQIMSLIKQSNTGVLKTGLPPTPQENPAFNLAR